MKMMIWNSLTHDLVMKSTSLEVLAQGTSIDMDSMLDVQREGT
jgi:hypothetical protein